MPKTSNERRADELEEIQEQIGELARRALALTRGTSEEQSAQAYWYAELLIALSDEHEYLGRSGHSMQDTIDGLRMTPTTDGEG